MEVAGVDLADDRRVQARLRSPSDVYLPTLTIYYPIYLPTCRRVFLGRRIILNLGEFKKSLLHPPRSRD